uniref:Uncharacterized protein n=1 Tax=Myoviridae sp. ct78050 TaxID=2826617 RepID=A0A8S5R111_9CAUD|nr:MAG TPA: hypothetical protein [Myoviridae sp. ct78050]
MILDLFIYIIQFYINQNTFLPGFIIRKRALKNLQKTGEIKKISTNQNTLIIVTKYDDYQCFVNVDNKQTTNEQHEDNMQKTNEQQTDNNKQ